MKPLLLLGLVILIFTACTPEREVIGIVPTLPPSATITPTVTSTPVVQPTLVASATAIVETPTPSPTRPQVTVVVPTPIYLTATPDFSGQVIGEEGANLREGASTFYPVIAQLDRGVGLTVIGQSADRLWLEVIAPGGLRGWVMAELVSTTTDRTTLAVTWTRLALQCGVNIHPTSRQGWNPLPPDLARVDWVRFPLVTASSASYAYWDEVINTYNQMGIKVLAILSQESYAGGSGDWQEITRGDWAAYIDGFIRNAERVVQHFGNRIAAYQIWNEGDGAPGNGASIPFPPAEFARLLDGTSQVIRQYAPESTIVMGGLASGPWPGAAYLTEVKTALGGRLPVDAIAIHPYGMGAPGDTTQFTIFGTLDEIFAPMQAVAPNVPIWITEIGAMGTDDPDDWPEVAEYMRGVFSYFASRSDQVPVVIWYAWSDEMHRSRKTNGLITLDRRPKPFVYDVFFNELCKKE